MGYAIYRREYNFFDWTDKPYRYEYHNSETPIEKFDTREAAEKRALQLEKESLISLDNRSEWHNLNQEQTIDLIEFIKGCGLKAPIEIQDDVMTFCIWDFDESRLTDEQLTTFLSKGAGGMYSVMQLIEEIKNVLFVPESGYAYESPHGYTDSLLDCQSFGDLDDILSDYGYVNYDVNLNILTLDKADFENKAFLELIEQYRSNELVNINVQQLDDSSGQMHIDYVDITSACFQEQKKALKAFNDVVENPSFILHRANAEDLIVIENNPYQLIKRFQSRQYRMNHKVALELPYHWK